jgi:hypothetical protein
MAYEMVSIKQVYKVSVYYQCWKFDCHSNMAHNITIAPFIFVMLVVDCWQSLLIFWWPD